MQSKNYPANQKIHSGFYALAFHAKLQKWKKNEKMRVEAVKKKNIKFVTFKARDFRIVTKKVNHNTVPDNHFLF